MVRGRHTIKVGGQFQYYVWNLFQDSQPDTLTFNTNYITNGGTAGSGAAFANVLLGQPFSVEDALAGC
jgi:hypothetical protein